MPIQLVYRLNHCPKLILANLNVKKHKYLIQINFEEYGPGILHIAPLVGTIMLNWADKTPWKIQPGQDLENSYVS
jgi:hypothetical protein